MKTEKDKAYERFKERSSQRQKAFISSIIWFIIVILVGFFSYNYGYLVYDSWVFIGGLSMFGLFIYFVTRPWIGENYETKIYVRVHEASKILGLVSSQDKNPLVYFQKAARKLEGAILVIGTLASRLKLMDSTLASTLADPLETLENRLEKRILPMILNQKKDESMMTTRTNVIVVLNHLAGIFNEENPLRIDDIVQENKILEGHTEIEVEKKPSRMKIIWSKESTKLLSSMIAGFVFIFAIFLVHSELAKYSIVEFLSNSTNFVEFLGVCIVVGGIIYEYRKRK